MTSKPTEIVLAALSGIPKDSTVIAGETGQTRAEVASALTALVQSKKAERVYGTSTYVVYGAVKNPMNELDQIMRGIARKSTGRVACGQGEEHV